MAPKAVSTAETKTAVAKPAEVKPSGKTTTVTGNVTGSVTENATVKAVPANTEMKSDATLQADFIKPEKLGPVLGRGRRPNPIPDDVVDALERSLKSCEGIAGNDGFKETITVNTAELTRAKSQHRKWKAHKEVGGLLVHIGYRTNPVNKPTKTHRAPVDFAVTLVADNRK